MADFQDLKLGALQDMITLSNSIGDNDLVDGALIDTLNGISTQETVRDQSVDLRRSFLLQKSSGACDGIGGVCKIVDQDSGAILDVTDKHHGGILAISDLGGTAFLFTKEKAVSMPQATHIHLAMRIAYDFNGKGVDIPCE